MTSITLNVTGARILAEVNGPLTSGMVGIPVTIRYDDSWNGLTKNLVCRCGQWGPEKGETRTVLSIGETATVAHEVMKADMYLYLGIEGYSADGKLVMPTTWADCGKIQHGANAGADPSTAPTRSAWAQLQGEIEQIKQSSVTDGRIASAVADYLEEHPIEVPDSSTNVDYTVLTNKPKINGVELDGDKTAEELGIGQPTDEQIDAAVSEWLDEHPEATTTVQDGSITEEKLADGLKESLKQSRLKGHSWAVLGDSISDDTTTYTKTWYWDYINNRNGGDMTIKNYGVAGNKMKALCQRYEEMDYCDIITVFAGVNDWGVITHTELGTIADTSTNTFYGALNTLCAGLVKTFPKSLIVFITPLGSNGYGNFPVGENSRGLTVDAYADAIVAVCKKYRLPCVDTRNLMLNPDLAKTKALYFVDGLHLNALGHEVLSYALEAELNRHYITTLTDADIKDTDVETYSITATLTNTSISNTATSIAEGKSYTATLTAMDGYTLSTVTVTMGGVNVTASVYADGVIHIEMVTGNIVITAEAAETVPDVITYTITNHLTNVTNSNAAVSVTEGEGYSATLTAGSGYNLDTVTVTMGGVDITSTVYSSGTVTIASVTGNVVITANAVEIPSFSITNELTNVTTNNPAVSVEENEAYTATLTLDDDYSLSLVTVTMGGVDVTDAVWNADTYTITIPTVTGDVIITATAVEIPPVTADVSDYADATASDFSDALDCGATMTVTDGVYKITVGSELINQFSVMMIPSATEGVSVTATGSEMHGCVVIAKNGETLISKKILYDAFVNWNTSNNTFGLSSLECGIGVTAAQGTVVTVKKAGNKVYWFHDETLMFSVNISDIYNASAEGTEFCIGIALPKNASTSNIKFK